MSHTHAPFAKPLASPRAKERQWPLNLTFQELLIDGLWILFFVGVNTAFQRPALLVGVSGTERFFWLPAYLAVFVAFLVWQRQFLLLAQKNAIFLTWPLIASLSAIWSYAPTISFYHGIQLLFTIMIGFLLFIHADLVRVLQLLISATLCCSLLSVVYVVLLPGQSISVFGEWQGAFGHKNTLGNLMTLQIITGMCLFHHGWRPFLCAGSIGLAVLLLLFSRSGTALVALAVTLAAIPPALAFRAGARPFFIVLAAILWVLAVAAFVVIDLELNVITSILQGLGKDETLSSRTILWDFAAAAFKERPWLGYGFKGYWNSWETSTAMLRYEIGQDLWFFHNVFLETAVAFGVLGPLLLAAGLFQALRTSLQLIAVSRGLVSFWPFLFVVVTTVQCFAEYPLFVNHSLAQTLFAATLATQWRYSILSRPGSVARASDRG